MLSGRLWPSPGATAAQFAERKNKENRDFKVSEPAKFSGLRRSFCARPPQAGEAKISPHQLRLLRFMGITLRYYALPRAPMFLDISCFHRASHFFRDP